MSSLSSLYQKSSGLPSYTGLSTLTTGGGLNGSYGGTASSSVSSYASDVAASTRLDAPFRSSYASDPLSLYGSSTTSYLSSNPPAPSGASWPQLDPLFPSLKRPGDEVFYPGDVLSKRPRFDMAPALPFYPQRPGEKDCVFYMRTRTCSFGANCKYDHPAWVPAGGIPDWKEVSTTATKTQPLPVRSGEPDCAFYIKTGICKFGSKCKFNHPEDKSTAATKNKSDESTDGNLKAEVNVIDTTAKIITPVLNGDVEGGSVAAKPVATFNAKGLPVRPGETECSFYMKTGSCKFGSACRFDHPEKPASVALQQSQTKVAPLLGGFSGGYGNFSIFPGALPDYGLGVLGSDFGLPSLAQAPIYPQRPGEATCSYYMKTGICKFGSSCKFHHPVNRKEAEPVVKLTLAGFPRREGEQPCPFYMKTGTCKYAFSCKFDHPPPGEAAAKAVAEAGKSEQPEVGEVVPIS